jgi:DNA-binding response OmpR family regulator
MQVLLIDDNKELRDFLCLALEESDVRCVAADTQDALRQLEESKFDVLIVDSVLKNTDGIALTGQIRAHRNGRNVPILLMSPIDTSLARRMAKDAGCNEFLPKPFGPAQFVEQVKSLKR